VTTFWSGYIILIVVINIVGVVWILFANKGSGQSQEAGEDTTGHTWDGDLAEYNNPLPRWWFGMFVITVVFGIAYFVIYPGFGSNAGVFGWTSAKETAADLKVENDRFEAVAAQYRNKPIEALESDKQALAIGHNIFANNCAVCHGSDARGAKGFPNLTDNDWLYGGTPDIVVTSITNGRGGVMPAWGPVLQEDGVNEVVNYVLTISGQAQKADAKLAEAGKVRFEAICAACHGMDGKGNQALGAPNLTDNIWLYGGTPQDIKETVTNGRNGRMPTWGPTLGKDRIRFVAAWVLSQSQHGGATPQ
jgi:cytochrome c oxidase cbb3-type subunit 3